MAAAAFNIRTGALMRCYMKNCKTFRFDETRLEQSALALMRAAANAGERLAVALSGGSDSVFLLHCAVQICGNQNLVALHFNHKVRKNADADADFCKSLCKKLGVKLVAKSRKENLKKISEDSLREIRQKFFEKECSRLKIGAILQGHIKTDISETMLMRLMRGASADGLCAPRPVSEANGLVKIRPLLTLAKPETQKILKNFGIEWREDESNFENKFLRNKLRNEILPELERQFDFSSSAARTRMLLEEDCRLISQIFKNSAKISGNKILLQGQYAHCPAVLRRAAQLLLAQKNIKLRAGAVDEFVSACAQGKSAHTSLKCGFLIFDAPENSMEIFRAKNYPRKKTPLKFGKNILPDGSTLELEKVQVSKDLFEKIRAGEFSEAKFAFIMPQKEGLFARGILPADAYAPIGAKSARLVKDMMSAKKTHILKRKAFPLVCLNTGEALWAPTLAPAEFCKLNKACRAFRLTYNPAF